MNFLPHLAGRVIGTPLLVEQARLETILSVIGPRVGVEPTGFASDAQPNDRMDDLIVTPNGIAIVPIHGTLVKRAGAVEAASGLMSYSAIENMLMDAVTDPSVKVLRCTPSDTFCCTIHDKKGSPFFFSSRVFRSNRAPIEYGNGTVSKSLGYGKIL